MDKSAFFDNLVAEFDNLVEEFIPPTEVGFKKYAKENLNPLFRIGTNFKMTSFMRLLYDGISETSIKFDGSSYSLESQAKYAQWSMQLMKLFIPLVTKAFLQNPSITISEKKQISERTNDHFSELAFQVPTELKDPLKEVSEYITDKTTKALDTLPKYLYYWEYDTTKLVDLYQLLLGQDFIQPNENFIQSFSAHEVIPSYKTVWKKEPENQTSLFALLYLLYNKQKYFKNESVGLIAHKLFKLNNTKFSKNNVNTAFNQFVERDRKDYLNKKHSQIVNLISRLNLNI